MIRSFFQKQKMKRAVWSILLAYTQMQDENATSDQDKCLTLIKTIITGAHLCAHNDNINFKYFLHLLISDIKKTSVVRNGTIDLETIVFSAANLRGPFPKHHKDIAKYFGISARKLNLDANIFDSFGISEQSFDSLCSIEIQTFEGMVVMNSIKEHSNK